MVVKAIKYKDSIKMTPFEKIRYIFRFITRAFLLAVFILFLLLIIFFIFYFGDLLYNIKTGNTKVPLFGAYVIVSPSMVPTIKVNDAIIIRRAKEDELEIGDIITFSSSDPSYKGLTITHRIVGKQTVQNGGYVYRTKGDNNNVEDSSLVKYDDIYGKVILKIPKLGYIQKFLLTPFGFIISILIPILLVIIFDIVRIYRMIKRKREEVIEII